MKHPYARAILALLVVALAATLAPAPAVAQDTANCDGSDFLVTLDVAPAVINLQKFRGQQGDDAGQWLTIHTNILYDQVAKNSAEVFFNYEPDGGANEPLTCWDKADDDGNYVAKCDIEQLYDTGGSFGEATITMKGEDTEGNQFCGEQDIEIIDDKGGPSSARGKASGK